MKDKEKISPLQRSLNVWAITIIIWSFYRYYFKTELPIWFDEFIAKPVVFLLPLYYFITHYEKKPLFERLDIRLRDNRDDIIMGISIGLVFFLTGFAAHWVKYKTFAPKIIEGGDMLAIASLIIVSFASSFTEEILSRGFILKRLYEETNKFYTSAVQASFLFFFMHIPILFSNNQIYGMALLQVMFTDLILSMAVSILYLQRKNVILPIIIHALYNLSIYFFI